MIIISDCEESYFETVDKEIDECLKGVSRELKKVGEKYKELQENMAWMKEYRIYKKCYELSHVYVNAEGDIIIWLCEEYAPPIPNNNIEPILKRFKLSSMIKDQYEDFLKEDIKDREKEINYLKSDLEKSLEFLNGLLGQLDE